MTKPKGIPPAAALVAVTPHHCSQATDILSEMQEPTHPYRVMFAPKWDGRKFTAGTVVCQHRRHRTKEGAARCAAAHLRALRGKKILHGARRDGTERVVGRERAQTKERPPAVGRLS